MIRLPIPMFLSQCCFIDSEACAVIAFSLHSVISTLCGLVFPSQLCQDPEHSDTHVERKGKHQNFDGEKLSTQKRNFLVTLEL